MEAAPRIRREARMLGELRALRRSGLMTEPRTNTGDGRAVLLIPGLLAPDRSLGLLAQYLKRHGFRPKRAGIASNVDCSEREMQRLVRRLERAADETGERVSVVGQSRGGVFGRALAVRRPDLVASVTTLGSPLVDPISNIHPFLHLQLELLARLGDRKVPRVVSHGCMDASVLGQVRALGDKSAMTRALVKRLESVEPGQCCVQFWEEVRAPFPDDVAYLSIWSRLDGIVNPRACLDPGARHLEIRSSHCGMAWNRHVFRAVLEELARQDPTRSGAGSASLSRA